MSGISLYNNNILNISGQISADYKTNMCNVIKGDYVKRLQTNNISVATYGIAG